MKQMIIIAAAVPAWSQQSGDMSTVVVAGQLDAYATQPQYLTKTAAMGPLGQRNILDTPTSVTTVPQDLMVNQQTRTVNDTLRYLSSVPINSTVLAPTPK